MANTNGKKPAAKRQVSVLNWMGTLLLCSIPGVNLIAIIIYMIFGKSPSKRHYAVALLLWMLIILLVIVVLMMLMPDRALDFADTLREMAQPTATPIVWQN